MKSIPLDFAIVLSEAGVFRFRTPSSPDRTIYATSIHIDGSTTVNWLVWPLEELIDKRTHEMPVTSELPQSK